MAQTAAATTNATAAGEDVFEALPHLRTAWDVDRRIVLDSADKLVCIRFSAYEHPPREALLPYMQRGHEQGNDNNTDNDDDNDERTHRAAMGVKRARVDDGRDTVATSTSRPSLLSSSSTARTGGSEAASERGMEHYLLTQQMDELLRALAPKVRKYCVIYAVNILEVPQFNELYELGDAREPFAVLFFYRNRHIRVDVGTGNNNKINFYAFVDYRDLLPIVDAAYRAGKQQLTMASVDRKFTAAAVRR